MKGNFSKKLRRYSLAALAVLLLSTFLIMTCDARGSGQTTTKSPTAGYKTGNYSTTKGSTGGSTQKSTTGGSTQKSTTGSGSVNNSTSGSGGKTTFFFLGGIGGGGSNGGSSSGGGSGSSILGFLFLVLIIVLIVIIVRRHRKKKGSSAVNPYPGEEFDVRQELSEFKELYAKLIFGIDDVDDFLEKADLDKRRSVKLLPVLNEYIKLLENTAESKQKAVPANLIEFRREHREELEKLKDCADCRCLKCARDCRMSGCSRCEPAYRCRIASCDNEKAAVYVFEDRSIELKNNDTGEDELLKVLAVVEDLEYKQLYIILDRGGEKVVLYYYPGMEGDSYGEITDTEDLEFAVNAYENIHLS